MLKIKKFIINDKNKVQKKKNGNVDKCCTKRNKLTLSVNLLQEEWRMNRYFFV